MKAELPVNIDKATFLTWVQTRERKRYELVEGVGVEAGLHTRAHAMLAGNLMKVLDAALGGHQWHVLLSFGVDTGPNTVRDPDVLVDRGGHTTDLTANSPVLIAEVLSPHSIETDLHCKPAEYMKLPSLLAYIVLSHDEPKAWLWVRDESGFAADARIVVGTDAVLRIPGLSIELPLGEIYLGIAPR